MAPFYGWGSAASRLEPLRGGSLLFTFGGRWMCTHWLVFQKRTSHALGEGIQIL